jgi:hypothetical protein
MRSAEGTTDFTSSDNMISMGINLVWNILSIVSYRHMAMNIFIMEDEYMMMHDGMKGGKGDKGDMMDDEHKQFCMENMDDEKCADMPMGEEGAAM